MIVKHQKPIEFINSCNCKVDLTELKNAIIWYSDKPVSRLKKIYMLGNYPAVSIYHEKVHVHRLLVSYWLQRSLDRKEYAHHKDRNKLNSLKSNLEIMPESAHQKLHNKGKRLSDEHKSRISKANELRKGTKQKKTVIIPIQELKTFLNKGYSINKIAKHYKCDWSTVKSRIYENPELLGGE